MINDILSSTILYIVRNSTNVNFINEEILHCILFRCDVFYLQNYGFEYTEKDAYYVNDYSTIRNKYLDTFLIDNNNFVLKNNCIYCINCDQMIISLPPAKYDILEKLVYLIFKSKEISSNRLFIRYRNVSFQTIDLFDYFFSEEQIDPDVNKQRIRSMKDFYLYLHHIKEEKKYED